ncbi:MAG TPA: pyruvate kinase [Thermodesulfobacteriota bacterium]|nr:pyruvate kinase [Thermodesulfobacteriota bacterium]
MIKTKIICTIGPASSRPETIRLLVESGMNVARLNFSHGTRDEHGERIRTIRRVSGELGRPVAIMQDLAGQKIRVGTVEPDPLTLRAGEVFTLTTRSAAGEPGAVTVEFPGFPRMVKPGDAILLSDGSIELRVTSTTETDVVTTVAAGGELSSRKGVNVPLHSLDVPAFTDKDREDLEFGIRRGVDVVAQSFARNAADVRQVRDFLKERGSAVPIVAKIENNRAIENIDGILNAVDGIMVARGDLGVETPLEKVPLVQKIIIAKSNAAGKTVITATHMLKSMVSEVRPTRAEAADVANAVLDGTDAVMLSEETAIGKYPALAAEILGRIAREAESSALFGGVVERLRSYPPRSDREAFGLSVCNLSDNIRASGIVTHTLSGYTARLIARYRPEQAVTAITPSEETYRQLAAVWGVEPVFDPKSAGRDLPPKEAVRAALESGAVRPGDKVVVTDGVSMSVVTAEG